MLGVNTYSQDHIVRCRELIDEQLSTYRALIAPAEPSAARERFEHRFFNNLVLALDQMFVHRLRGQEGKDGNPLNEVRMLTTSIVEHGGHLVKDKQIKLDPATSVLGLEVGDVVRMTEAQFLALANAFFDEIAIRFA
jgi:hypothetical protein